MPAKEEKNNGQEDREPSVRHRTNLITQPQNLSSYNLSLTFRASYPYNRTATVVLTFFSYFWFFPGAIAYRWQ
jgi:hypothetical protein